MTVTTVVMAMTVVTAEQRQLGRFLYVMRTCTHADCSLRFILLQSPDFSRGEIAFQLRVATRVP
jgi:hypothetical protein